MTRFLAFITVWFVALGFAWAEGPVHLPAATEQSIHNDVDGAVHEAEGVEVVVDGAVHHEEAAGPPQFAAETFPSQLFWLALSFGVMYLLFAGAVLPRISQGMVARESHIKNLLADARRMRDEAEKHKNDMSSAADAAHQQAHDILNRVTTEAREIASRRQHELEAVLQSKQQKSEERIAQARAGALQSIKEAAAMLLPEVTDKLAGLSLSPQQVKQIVDSAEPAATQRMKGAA